MHTDYRYNRSYGNITLHHPTTVRSICSSFGMNPQIEHDDATFLSYVKRRITNLDHHQRFVSLMIDEINTKPYFDYKGGSITGVAHNSNEAANTAVVFMVQSLTCQFKGVAHIVPLHRADAEFLHNLVRDIICGLENIGYRVIAVVSDNNSVNRKAICVCVVSVCVAS